MKITFEFNEEAHAFRLVPDNDLEQQVLLKMAQDSEKGKSVTLTKIEHPSTIHEFKVEIKVNGK